MKEILYRVGARRKDLGITQDALAKQVGIRRETISRLEKGQYNPSLKLAYELADALDTSVEDIFQWVEVQKDKGGKSLMVYLYREAATETETILKGLTTQTESGRISWECTEYHPLGLLYQDDDPDKTPQAVISQSFNAQALVRGRPVFISLTDVLNVDTGKGDLHGAVTLDEDVGGTPYEFMLSIYDEYEDMDTQSVAYVFREQPCARFFDAIIPRLSDSEAVAFGFSFARFINTTDVPPKYSRFPLVRLSKKLMKEKRALDFHKLILDMDVRAELLEELKAT